MPIHRRQSGFTLVELLVVISIIVILSAIGLTIYSQAQKSSRIARRIRDLKAIQTALETYYTQYGSYPDIGTAFKGQCAGFGGLDGNAVIPGLVPTYMPALPQDPQMNATTNKNCYLYGGTKTDYKVIDYNVDELTTSDLQKNPTMWDPVHTQHPEHTGCVTNDDVRRFAVYTTVGRCW